MNCYNEENLIKKIDEANIAIASSNFILFSHFGCTLRI